ncbi:hypothetical protein XJ44_00485 [Thermosipho affectus]|uniref:GAF domain-containing protein n=1 Tax=Thermosipho affectus TaxID=660294 RepID=A0ABX3IJQ3_9BACT|nr:hypothetical protein [Thermosipho affectus]ONN28055.1 hypothetical protein XJ44_00485 [Thermosipho affectus]
MKKLTDILLVYESDDFEIVSTIFSEERVKKIFSLFLKQNRFNLLDGMDKFFFEFEDEIFEVDVEKDGYKYIISFKKINDLVSKDLKAKMFNILGKILDKFICEWLEKGFNRKENYSNLTELFVENFPEIDGALFSTRDGDILRIRGASGFDYEIMKDVFFTLDEVYSERLKRPMIVKLDDVAEEYYLNVDNERMKKVEFLMKYAHLTRILSMLSIPFYKNNELFGFISLYNFENEFAFENENYMYLANVLSKLFTGVFNKI